MSMFCANGCGQPTEAKKGSRGPTPTYCSDKCRQEAKAKYLAERYENERGDRKRYDTINKPSATVKYRHQKNRESYHRHKTVPDRQFGVYKTPEEVKATRKAWYKKNKEHAAEQARQYAAANPEKVKATTKAYEGRPEVKAKHRQWECDNPEKVTNQRKRRYGTKGYCTKAQWEARLAFYGNRCYMCGIDLSTLPQRQRTKDHVIPISRGGTDWPANLRPACQSCNSSKQNRLRKL